MITLVFYSIILLDRGQGQLIRSTKTSPTWKGADSMLINPVQTLLGLLGIIDGEERENMRVYRWINELLDQLHGDYRMLDGNHWMGACSSLQSVPEMYVSRLRDHNYLLFFSYG